MPVDDTRRNGADDGSALPEHVKEYLEHSWSSWFDGLTITHAADGTTTLAGPVRDQSALYGLIDKARDLGLNLIAVGRSVPSVLADEPRV